MVLADTTAMSAGTIYDGNGEWGDLPDANNPGDPRHNCIIYKVAFANTGGSSLLSPYGDHDPCNEILPAFKALTRHSEGSNLTFADGHSKWLRDSAISIDYVMGTFAK